MVDRALLRLVSSYEKFTSADYAELEKEFERFFPAEMDLLKQVGIHPSVRKFQPNPYIGKRDREDYRNIGQHSMAVGFACYVLGKSLGLSASEIEEVISRGLTHDLGKKMELMRKKAAVFGDYPTDPFSFEAYRMLEETLANAGYSRDTIRHMSLAKKTGHIGIINYLVIKGGKVAIKDADILDLIVHLTDDYTWTSKNVRKGMAMTCYLPVAERMQAQKFNQQLPFLYCEGVGFSARGELVVIKDFPGNHGDPDRVVTEQEWNKWCKKQHPELSQTGTFAHYQEWASNEISRHLLSLQKNPGSGADTKAYWVKLLNDSLRRKHHFFPELFH